MPLWRGVVRANVRRLPIASATRHMDVDLQVNCDLQPDFETAVQSGDNRRRLTASPPNRRTVLPTERLVNGHEWGTALSDHRRSFEDDRASCFVAS